MADIIISYKTGAEVAGAKATIDRLEHVLLTPRGSVMGDPEYGFDIYGLLDEQLTRDLELQIKNEIQNIIIEHFPEIIILGLTVTSPYTAVVRITLEIKIIPENITTSFSLEYTND